MSIRQALRRSCTLGQVLALAMAMFGATAQVAAQGDAAGFDLAAEFITEKGYDGTDISYCESGPRGQCAVKVRFQNLGDAPSPRIRVGLNMWRGKTASGYAQMFGGSSAYETLPELKPGKYLDVTFSGRASRGEYTFKTKYASALNDANNRNHDITKTITLVSPQREARERETTGAEGGFDLAAEFITEKGYDGADISYCESGPRGQCSVKVRFQNLGDAPSPPIRVGLNMWRGKTASGYAQMFGGSSAYETLPPLEPGKYLDVIFSGRASRGEYTFKTKYPSALNDANNNNHDITKTITLATQR